jgi:fluoride ion exporter CrcB/FEX
MSWVVFACVFVGALLGIVLRRTLPKHHLNEDSKDAVKLGMGLIATMAALVLALLIASAKSSHDTQTTEVTEMSADFILLDRTRALRTRHQRGT